MNGINYPVPVKKLAKTMLADHWLIGTRKKHLFSHTLPPSYGLLCIPRCDVYEQMHVWAWANIFWNGEHRSWYFYLWNCVHHFLDRVPETNWDFIGTCFNEKVSPTCGSLFAMSPDPLNGAPSIYPFIQVNPQISGGSSWLVAWWVIPLGVLPCGGFLSHRGTPSSHPFY